MVVNPDKFQAKVMNRFGKNGKQEWNVYWI